MQYIKYLSISSLLAILLGQIIRIPAVGGVITILDVLLSVNLLFFLLYLGKYKKIYLPKKLLFPLIIFCTVAAASNLIAISRLGVEDVLISSLFLVRFIVYASSLVIFTNIIQKNLINNWVKAFLSVGLIYSLIGFAQFIFVPDLRFLTEFGWDPHYFRLTSSFLDPNFSGIFLTILFAFSFTFFLYKKNNKYLLLSFIFATSILLTFSRSSYLAFTVAILIISLAKSPKYLLISAIIFTAVFIFIPRTKDRIVGALTIDVTSQARIKSWQTALKVFKKYPLFGTGFNTYRATQADLGLFSFENPKGTNAGAGSDSSLLFVLATTGVFGTAAFIAFVSSALLLTIKNVLTYPIKLASLASLVALIVHSQFVNSLFFPPIMLVMFFILALASKYDN